jgi:hypothetical protein
MLQHLGQVLTGVAPAGHEQGHRILAHTANDARSKGTFAFRVDLGCCRTARAAQIQYPYRGVIVVKYRRLGRLAQQFLKDR